MKLRGNGFVLAEFVIALPLLIFLLFALGRMTFQIILMARSQAADYVLETEAQEILERLTSDARAASSVEIRDAGMANLQQIIFVYNTIDPRVTTLRNIMDTRRYTVAEPVGGVYHVISKRRDDNFNTTPISGGNFFGDTAVTQLKFSKSNKVLHITLEMQSFVTDRKIKVNTSVFMPSCE